MRLTSPVMRTLIIHGLLVAPVIPARSVHRAGRLGPVRPRSRDRHGPDISPAPFAEGHARILVVQFGLPALPQIRMLFRRITHVGYSVRRLRVESGFENLKFYQADFPLLPGPVARAELHTFGRLWSLPIAALA
jgi:hypothetical protein